MKKIHTTLRKQQFMNCIPLSNPLPTFLQSEYWCGTKASQLEAPISFGFHEVLMTQSYTSVMKFLSGKSHLSRWEIRADTNDNTQAFGRSKDSALPPKAIARCSGDLPLQLRDSSLKENTSNSGAGLLTGKWRLLNWILQILDTSLSKSEGT